MNKEKKLVQISIDDLDYIPQFFSIEFLRNLVVRLDSLKIVTVELSTPNEMANNLIDFNYFRLETDQEYTNRLHEEHECEEYERLKKKFENS